jgi:hypothetical protein
MISIDTVIKNQDLASNTRDFENMKIEELNYYHRKYINLANNKKLINSLSDRGERIRKTLDIIEVFFYSVVKSLLKKKILTFQSLMNKQKFNNHNALSDYRKSVDAESNSKKQVDKPIAELTEDLEDNFKVLLENFDDETLKEELLKELKSPENLNQSTDNYYKIKNKQLSLQTDEKKTIGDIDQIKLRLIEKYKLNETDRKSTKTIPINESLKLFYEQSKQLEVKFL